MKRETIYNSDPFEKNTPPYRCNGTTTRLVDMFIQKLFNERIVKIYDHYGSINAAKRTFDLVLSRLSREHPADYSNLEINRSVLVLKFKDFKI